MAKRANNEGTIYKRSDGSFEAKLLIGWTEEGKPKYKYFRGAKQADVKERWEAAKGEIRTGKFVEPNKILFKNWLDTWLESKKISIKDTTYTQYNMLIKIHIKPALGGIKLVNMQTVHIQELYNRLLKDGKKITLKDKETGKLQTKIEGLSAQTIRHIHKVISGSLDQAIKEKYLLINPANAITLPRMERKEMSTLSMEQIQAFLNKAKTGGLFKHYYPAFLLEIYTGLRRGEILGLRWKDIDFNNYQVKVVQQLVLVANKPVLRDLKTKSSNRVIVIADEVITALKEHKVKKMAEYKLLGHNDIEIKKMTTEGLVFTSEVGTPVYPENFVRCFKGVLKASKLPNIRFHDMRHTFALLSLQAGVDVKTLQSDLGHESIETTLDRYGHVNEEMKKSGAEKRSSLLKTIIN